MYTTIALLSLLSVVSAQMPDNNTEVHPKLTTYKCTTDAGCVPQTSALVLNHGIYQRDHPELSCGDWGSAPNATVCPDQETCQKNCAIWSVSDYCRDQGVCTDGSELQLVMLREDGQVNSPRLYLLNEAEDEYEMLKLTGQEVSFDVDMSKLPCGMNAALYTVEMDPTGGQNLSTIPTAGAAYGNGYCDAQCYTTPFSNGLANINGSGVCCNELDIWEANARATQFAPHTCNQTGVYLCDRASGECDSDGVCDKSGCGQNPYAMGYKEYYGPGMTVDTTRPFKVITQFPADASGVLTSYKRLYVQDGAVIEMPTVNVSGVAQNTVDDAYCAASEKYLGLGGTTGMGESMSRGMVLTISLWWDDATYMQWLDGSANGAGPCNATQGNPTVIQAIQPDTQVTFSEIRWGDIGSTFSV